MAIFLFLILLVIDIVKDFLTKNADKIFGYSTIPNQFGNKIATFILAFLSVTLLLISMLIIRKLGIHNMMNIYFAAGLFVLIFIIYLLLNPYRKSNFFVLNILRIWVFIGIISMLLDLSLIHIQMCIRDRPYSFYKGALKFSELESDFEKESNISLQTLSLIHIQMCIRDSDFPHGNFIWEERN